MSGKKTKKTDSLSVSYYEEDLPKIIWYYLFLHRRLERDERIPARVLKRFLSFFKATQIDEAKLRSELVSSAKDKTLKFINEKKYELKVETLEPVIEERKIKRNGYYADLSELLKPPRYQKAHLPKKLDEIINYIFSELDSDTGFLKASNKAELVVYVFTTLNNYMKQYEKQPITDYQMMVITGFVASTFGFIASEEQFKAQPNTLGHYTQFLHRSVEYLCKKQTKRNKTTST